MENHEEMWMQYLRNCTSDARDRLARTGLVIGAGFGPGANVVGSPLFGMMLTSNMTGVCDGKSLTEPINPFYHSSNKTMELWKMAMESRKNSD